MKNARVHTTVRRRLTLYGQKDIKIMEKPVGDGEAPAGHYIIFYIYSVRPTFFLLPGIPWPAVVNPSAPPPFWPRSRKWSNND